jgi:hypothetical protein
LTSVTGRPELKCVIPGTSHPCVQRFETRKRLSKAVL